MNTVQLPAEYILAPRRRPHVRSWVVLLVMSALAVSVMLWPTPAPKHGALVGHHHAAAAPYKSPYKSRVVVTVGKAVYACTVRKA